MMRLENQGEKAGGDGRPKTDNGGWRRGTEEEGEVCRFASGDMDTPY